VKKEESLFTAMKPKLEVFKQELARRALEMLRMFTEHEAGLMSDDELTRYIVANFPVTYQSVLDAHKERSDNNKVQCYRPDYCYCDTCVKGWLDKTGDSFTPANHHDQIKKQ
jgi:hypothetical protein